MQPGQDDRKESPEEKQAHLRNDHVKQEREVQYMEQEDPWPRASGVQDPKWYSIKLVDPPLLEAATAT